MLMIISPAKTLDETPMQESIDATLPRFWDACTPLVRTMQGLSAEQLAALMNISPKLAQLNVDRYAAFPKSLDDTNSKAAIFCFDGDVYDAITPQLYDAPQRHFMQDRLRILSGLYGLLRPLDRLYPYRLEMGTRIPAPQATTLYDFWGSRITDAMREDAHSIGATSIINLASQEYSRAIHWRDLNMPQMHVEFRQHKSGKLVTVGILAKKARGAMVDFVIRHGLTHHEDMKAFSEMGYQFSSPHSTANTMVFIAS